MNPVKTVAALHDLSGVGRSALTVVIPIISAMGVQVCPAPTAALSTHTALPSPVVLDMTDYLERCLNRWNEMGLRFDCIYTGYLAAVRQEEIARRFMDAQERALRVVDPVLGDDGRMYTGLPADMPEAMKRLCASADIITPNLTEAALLTGLPYKDQPMALHELREYLERLLLLGPKTALITGFLLEDVHVNAWMSEDGEVRMCTYAPIPASYPGTGDLFASVLAGGLTKGMKMNAAVRLATEYACETILTTIACNTDPRYGVQLEKTLGLLTGGIEE